jgi:hypothetical protein
VKIFSADAFGRCKTNDSATRFAISVWFHFDEIAAIPADPQGAGREWNRADSNGQGPGGQVTSVNMPGGVSCEGFCTYC